MTISRPTIQPIIACGPPSAVSNSGIVMNGPMPIMFDMLRAVACSKPKRLGRWSCPRFPGVVFISRIDDRYLELLKRVSGGRERPSFQFQFTGPNVVPNSGVSDVLLDHEDAIMSP